MPQYPRRYYRYNDLPSNSVRLLRIHPTSEKVNPITLQQEVQWCEDQLWISVETFKLSQCPKYAALSYTWGLPGAKSDPEPVVFTEVERVYPICCENSILLGTWNLRAAMRRLRFSMEIQVNLDCMAPAVAENVADVLDDTTYIWIDALCINQDNLAERAQQVRAMGQIYKQAHRTVVWLGESDELTDQVYQVLAKLKYNFEEAVDRYRDQRGIGPNSSFSVPMAQLNSLRLDVSEMRACAAFFNRNWFRRNWVLQEIILSRRPYVFIGSKVFDFAMLERAQTLNQLQRYRNSTLFFSETTTNVDAVLYSNRVYGSMRFLAMLARARANLRNNHLPGFTSVMRMCASLGCANDRDKIYSVLAICREFKSRSGPMILPNYNDDVDQVFIQATEAVINTRLDLLVLHLAPSLDATKILPSWCPDYTSTFHSINLSHTEPDVWRFPTAYEPVAQVDHSVLRAFGQCIGSVVEKARHVPLQEDSWLVAGIDAIMSLLTRIKTGTPSSFKYNLQNVGPVEIFWRSLFPKFPSFLSDVAGLEDPDQLPSGAAILLPTFLRAVLIWYLMRATPNFNSTTPVVWNDYSSSPFEGVSVSDLAQYGSSLEVSLKYLREQEPKDANFLPRSGQMARICSETGLIHGQVIYTLLNMDSEDRSTWRELATTLELDLPETVFMSSKANYLWGISFEQLDEGRRNAFDAFSAFMDTLTFTAPIEVFRTDSSLFGLTSSSILQQGDQLWILHGAHAPLLLRPLANGNFCYLGDTFMYGLMKGEAIPLCQDPITISIE